MKAKMTFGAWLKKKFEQIEKKLTGFVDGEYVDTAINNNIFDHMVIKDSNTSYKYYLKIRDGILTTEAFPVGFSVNIENIKTTFYEGEYISTDDLDVSVTYPNGNEEKITDWSNVQFSRYLDKPLTKQDNELTLTYVFDNKELFATTLSLTIIDFDPAVVLIDFNYTDNGDGTYTITSWKQTLNGENSTEIIIPNNGKIKL